MKSTESFKKSISDHLGEVADKDPQFAEKMKNDKKSIDQCVTYILNQVQKSGCNGFTDEEIYGMAIHYYDEAKIDVGKLNESTRVVVNHVVELTDAEKAEAKQKAIDVAIAEEKEKILNKKSTGSKSKETVEQQTLF